MKHTITPERFIRAWQSSERLSEVADKLGSSRQAVLGRAKNYRSHGVKLKSLKRRPRIDWEAAKKLALRLLK